MFKTTKMTTVMENQNIALRRSMIAKMMTTGLPLLGIHGMPEVRFLRLNRLIPPVEEDPDFLQVKKYPTPGSKNREDAAGIRNIRNLNQQPELASSDPEKPQNPAYASIDDNPAPTRGRGGRGRGGRGRPPRGRAGATAGPPRGKKV